MTSALDQKGLEARITAYLSGGGLFNPELANHEAVRDLLIDCRAYLSTVIPAEIAGVVTDLRKMADTETALSRINIAHKAATLIKRLAASQAETRRLALEEAAKLRTGDHVYHIPSGETWVVAWADYETGYMSACGWPESIARISDCALVKKANDAESAELVANLSKSGRRDAHRAARIRALIDQPSTEGGKDGQ